MSNMKDKIILITGSTDGIGLQSAIDLSLLGAHVLVHGRNETRASAAADRVRSKSSSGKVDFVFGDLAVKEEIVTMSELIHREYDHIDVLINNAGVIKDKRELNADGYEMTFAVNHLAYYLLTGLLLDLVLKSEDSRIINVASQAHASSLEFDNLQGEKYYESTDAYSRSKLCNILFTYRLARMLGDEKVSVNALHPGVIGTKLLLAGWGSRGQVLNEGSKTSVYLASSDELTGVSGKYFSKMREIPSYKVSYDEDIQDRLWQESEKLSGFSYLF